MDRSLVRCSGGNVAAALREIFNAEGYEQAKEPVTHVLEQLAHPRRYL